jgi:hypothetical protein
MSTTTNTTTKNNSWYLNNFFKCFFFMMIHVKTFSTPKNFFYFEKKTKFLVRQISLRNFRPSITQINGNNNHPLDAILDELGENNNNSNRKQLNGQNNNEIQASFTLRVGSNNKEENW